MLSRDMLRISRDENRSMRASRACPKMALERGGTVYVHCWGGVGRTGTVVGCHLVRRGMTGDEALARVGELFTNMEKSSRRSRSPETDEQEAYVREWGEALPNANRGDSASDG